MRKRRYEMQKCNDNKNILIWDNETGECLGFIAQIKGRLNLQDDIIKDQQATIDKLDQENADLLGARIKAQEEWEKCTDKLKKKIVEQQATIQSLKERLYDFEKQKIIEESEIDDDVIPRVKLLRTELFGEKYE